jgi:hypothetical protein
MSAMSETVALGGREFALRPLKLGQLRHLLDALAEMAGKSGGGLIEAAAKVVASGLAASHPDLGIDGVLDLEAGVDELNAAVAAILRVAGLQPAADAPENALGEAQPVAIPMATPGADPAASSAPSTAPSPPAAPTPTR